MKKNSKSPTKKEQTSKRTNSQRPVQRETKEVLAEQVEKLRGKLALKAMAASPGQVGQPAELRPQSRPTDRGSGFGRPMSPYCILGLEGETLSEGQVRTTQADVVEFFEAITAARVVIGGGTHSAWVQENVAGCGHEVLVANPRLMEGAKRRKRKNDRIDANKLARLGRVIPSRCTRCGTAVGKCARTWCRCEPRMRWWRHGRIRPLCHLSGGEKAIKAGWSATCSLPLASRIGPLVYRRY